MSDNPSQQKRQPARKPFGGKGGRRRRPSQGDLDKIKAQERLRRLEGEGAPLPASDIGSMFGSFFYVNDGFIDKFEDEEIAGRIRERFPGFRPDGSESALRRAVLDMLKDQAFVKGLLDEYGMTILDFFKFLFRVDSSIYSGSFIQKVQKALRRKTYAAVKKHRYAFHKKPRRRPAGRA